jgi:hypothetical protein
LQHHGHHVFLGGVQQSIGTPPGKAGKCNSAQWQLVLYIMLNLRTIAWARTHAIFNPRYGEISSCTTPTEQLHPNNRFIGFHLIFSKDLSWGGGGRLGMKASFFLKTYSELSLVWICTVEAASKYTE